jgi:hypothetical protein
MPQAWPMSRYLRQFLLLRIMPVQLVGVVMLKWHLAQALHVREVCFLVSTRYAGARLMVVHALLRLEIQGYACWWCMRTELSWMHADGRGADPHYPLRQTQAGVLEHLQFYVSDMSPSEHAECSEVIKRLRGSKRTTLGAYVTHIIVDEDACQGQEMKTILEFLEETANVCTVVLPSWLRACAQVGPCMLESMCLHSAPLA